MAGANEVLDDRPIRVAVVTGVYRSAELLEPCLASLRSQSFDSYAVYAYDNSGRDLLRALQDEPWMQNVSVVTLEENRGFAGGNNAAISLALEERPGVDYVVLLNDDTKADSEWLAELVSHADQNPQVGAISSKLVYYEPYARVRVSTSGHTAGPNDRRTIGVRLHEGSGFANSEYPNVFYRSGMHGLEGDPLNQFRWTSDDAVVDFPCGMGEASDLMLRVSPHEPGATIEVHFAGQVHRHQLEAGVNEFSYSWDSAEQQTHRFDILQNVGNTLDAEFNPVELNSGLPDPGVPAEASEVDAACGAAMLLRTEAIRRTGLLSELLFHYFEDTDLSLRIRQAGYQVHYLPSAKVRHYHAFSSGGEWSSSFTSHVVRNRVLFTALHGTKKQLRNKVQANVRDLVRLLPRAIRSRSASDLAPHVAANVQLFRDIPKAVRVRYANRNL